jgi:hypothetical protein
MRSEMLSWWPVLIPVTVFVAALAVTPVHQSFVNGARCVSRYPMLWKIPALFALLSVLAEIVGFLLLHWRAQDDISWHLFKPDWGAALLQSAAKQAWLPSLESLAATLNCLVATYPLSALFALAFLSHATLVTGELRRALRKRFGGWGIVLFLVIVVCALAAIAKPITLLALPEFSNFLAAQEAMPAAAAISALSFVFEYLLGTCFQVFLLTVALCWVRGLDFDRKKLWGFSVRRLGFVIKWSLVIITLTLLLILIPTIIECLVVADPLEWRMQRIAADWFRPLLAIVMLLLCTVQIRLVLHNDSLRGAIRANWTFLRAHFATLTAFFLAAISLLFVLKGAESTGFAVMGYSIYGLAWQALVQTITAGVAGWLLASWVCFYKSRESGASEIKF